MNRSNLIHALVALVISAPFMFFAPWVGVGFSFGIFVGIEWMQQTYIHVRATGRGWPTKLDIYDVLAGLKWDNRDRFGDCFLGLLLTSLVAYIVS